MVVAWAAEAMASDLKSTFVIWRKSEIYAELLTPGVATLSQARSLGSKCSGYPNHLCHGTLGCTQQLVPAVKVPVDFDDVPTQKVGDFPCWMTGGNLRGPHPRHDRSTPPLTGKKSGSPTPQARRRGHGLAMKDCHQVHAASASMQLHHSEHVRKHQLKNIRASSI